MSEPTKFAMYKDDVRELIERIEDDIALGEQMARIIERHALAIMRENEQEHSNRESLAP